MNSNLFDFFSQLQENHSKIDFSNEEWKCNSFHHDFFQGNEPSYFDLDTAPEFLRKQLDSDQTYLDLGCGEFRLAKHLINFEGVGIDLSFQSLSDRLIPSVVANLHNLPIDAKFDLILLGFGQICLMGKEQLRKLLKRLKKLLNPKGKIYIDLPTIDYIQEFHQFNTWKIEGSRLEIFSRDFDPVSSLFHQSLFSQSQDGTIRKYEFSYQFYSLYELLELFRDLRLQVLYGCEDFSDEPIKEGSEWMIFILQKN